MLDGTEYENAQNPWGAASGSSRMSAVREPVCIVSGFLFNDNFDEISMVYDAS